MKTQSTCLDVLIFVLTCCVNYGKYVFLNSVQSAQFATGGHKSSSKHITRLIKGCTLAQFGTTTKGLYTK